MSFEKVEESLDVLVVALCLDYSRRQQAIEGRCVTKRVDTEFRYYNFKIFDATAEIVGDALAESYIEEIGKKIGYAKSSLYEVSEATYKKYKKLIKENIAKKLHLTD